MTNSGDNPAVRPASAVRSHPKRDGADGIGKKGVVHLAAGPDNAVSGNELAEDSGVDKGRAFKGEVEKADPVAGNKRAEDMAVRCSSDLEVKAEPVAGNKSGPEMVTACKRGAKLEVEKAISGSKRAADPAASNKRSAEPASGPKHVADNLVGEVRAVVKRAPDFGVDNAVSAKKRKKRTSLIPHSTAPVQIKTEKEVEDAHVKEQMVLNLHDPGYECAQKYENMELEIDVNENDHNKTKLEESGTELSSSRIVFIGNIPFTVDHNQLQIFFKDIGRIADIRIATHPEGKSKGYAHIEFSTGEAAQEALKLNGKDLMGRKVRLNLASEFQFHTKAKGVGRVCVRGFRNGMPKSEVRRILGAHFSKCGDIKYIYIPLQNSLTNGVAYIDFSSHLPFWKAVEQDGVEVAGFRLSVQAITSGGGFKGPPSGSRFSVESGKEFGD